MALFPWRLQISFSETKPNKFPTKNKTMSFGFAFQFYIFMCMWACVQSTYETLVLMLQSPLIIELFIPEKNPKRWKQNRTAAFSICNRCKRQVEAADLQGLFAATQTFPIGNYCRRKPSKQHIPHGSQWNCVTQELTLQCAITFHAVNGSWVSPDLCVINFSESSISCHCCVSPMPCVTDSFRVII